MAIVSSLIYFVSPIDLIPDFVTGAGHVDDALVITTALNLFKSDVEEYKAWRLANGKEIN